MTASRGYIANGGHIGMSLDDLDDMQPQNHRFSSIGLRSHNQEYQHQETRNGDRHQTSKSERSNFCSKRCVIGLCIGLAIGILLVVAVAVPVGVLKTCSLGTISSTPNWIGTFQMDSACDTTRCCCLSNQVKFFQTTNYQMQMTASATGICTGVSTTLSLTLPMLTSFQTTIPWGGQSISLLLGLDNSYIAFVNTYAGVGYCSATALRTSYNVGSMKSTNLGLVMFMLLITIGIMK